MANGIVETIKALRGRQSVAIGGIEHHQPGPGFPDDPIGFQLKKITTPDMYRILQLIYRDASV